MWLRNVAAVKQVQTMQIGEVVVDQEYMHCIVWMEDGMRRELKCMRLIKL